MIDLDSSTGVLEIFAVTGGDKKRVEVSKTGRLTDVDRKIFRRAKEAGLQPWLDHKAFDEIE